MIDFKKISKKCIFFASFRDFFILHIHTVDNFYISRLFLPFLLHKLDNPLCFSFHFSLNKNYIAIYIYPIKLFCNIQLFPVINYFISAIPFLLTYLSFIEYYVIEQSYIQNSVGGELMSDNLLNGLLGGFGKDNNLLILLAILFLFGGGSNILGDLGNLGNFGGSSGGG